MAAGPVPGAAPLFSRRHLPISADMKRKLPPSIVLGRLRAAGLRPTRQRVALARLLLENGNRHVTAEQLHSEARAAAIPVSLATVYNTLHQFIHCGMLRELVVEPGRSYFDTNLEDHHHFYCESTGLLQDIAAELVTVGRLPEPPPGAEISRVEVIVRIRQEARPNATSA
jgi:Fur family iron response transcriptional regulator